MLSLIALFSLLASPIYASALTYPGTLPSYDAATSANRLSAGSGSTGMHDSDAASTAGSSESFFRNPFGALVDALSPSDATASTGAGSVMHHIGANPVAQQANSNGNKPLPSLLPAAGRSSSTGVAAGRSSSTSVAESSSTSVAESSSTSSATDQSSSTGALGPLSNPTEEALLFATCSPVNPAYATVNWYANSTDSNSSVLAYNICHVPSMQKKYLSAFRLQNYPNQYGSKAGAASVAICGPLSESKVDCSSRIKFPTQCLVGRVNLPMEYDPNSTTAVLTLISNPPATSLARLCL
jgi:hypothetical protein